MSRRRTSPASFPPLDNEDLLREILLRLPPRPSSLPRASLVCKRWRSILSDPDFLKSFRKHHKKPPLLGIFKHGTFTGCKFVPLLRMEPDCIPTERFAVPVSGITGGWRFKGCRHGLAVLLSECRREVAVWDPLTGQQRCVSFPPGLHDAQRWSFHVAVMCADDEDGHVHGDCFSSPFKLVLNCGGTTHAFSCLYESASGVWGNVASAPTTDATRHTWPSILIGSALYWLTCHGDILAFDIERQTLGVIEKPAGAIGTGYGGFQLLRTDDSGLGFAVMLQDRQMQLWKRKPNCDSVVGWWLLQKTIQIEQLIPRELCTQIQTVVMAGYDEDLNVIFLTTHIGRDFMLELDSMRFIRSSQVKNFYNTILCPYRNFYTAGKGVGWKWLDLQL